MTPVCDELSGRGSGVPFFFNVGGEDCSALFITVM